MVGAYILVKTRMGKMSAAASKIVRIGNVKNVSFVSGVFDIIVHVEVPNVSDLIDVTDSIHTTGDIEQTVTHVVSHEKKPANDVSADRP